MFKLVLWSIDDVKKCEIREVLDTAEVTVYVVSKKEIMDKKIEVRTETKEGVLRSISCSCRKLDHVPTYFTYWEFYKKKHCPGVVFPLGGQ